jgi:hypothetical protein
MGPEKKTAGMLPMLYMAKTRPVDEPAVFLRCYSAPSSTNVKEGGGGTHMEVLLVRRHGVETTHQRSIVAVETSTQVSNEKTSVQSHQWACPGAVLGRGCILGKLDSMAGLAEIFWKFSMGGCVLLLVDHVGHARLIQGRHIGLEQVLGQDANRGRRR